MRQYKKHVGKIVKHVKQWVNYLAAAMVVTIFITFCANVIFRYTVGKSFGWIVEFSLILWVWVILLGAGVFLHDDDHVSFVYMHRTFGKKLTLLLKIISFSIIFFGGIFMISPVWDYINFLQVRSSDVMGIPMNRVFGVYKIFLIAIIVGYGYKIIVYVHRLVQLVQEKDAVDRDAHIATGDDVEEKR